jgi:chlorite dismutase
VPGVLYEDLNDPHGIALLVSRDADLFVDLVRPVCTSGVFASYTLKPNYTMFGRTYSLGYERTWRMPSSAATDGLQSGLAWPCTC